MTPQFRKSRIVTALAVLLALATFGCGKSKSVLPLFANQRPTLQLTSAPINEADTAFYAYELHWSGNDPDGRIDHYDYAIDPKGGAFPETTWISTTRNGETVHFRASQPDTTGAPITRAIEPHTFVIRAFDNAGLGSPVVSRTFFARTIAPTVQIISPSLGYPTLHGFELTLGPTVRIAWEGEDPDGGLRKRPTRYKYRLIGPDDPESGMGGLWMDLQAARRHFASTNFAGWDSTGPDSAFVLYRNLRPLTSYVFIVIAFDEAGAWTADWTDHTNVLSFRVGYPPVMGPQIRLWSNLFDYMYPSGSYEPFDPLSWVKLEVPANQSITVNWSATPSRWYAMGDYRWRLDGDITDETPRTNEATDWYHWSQWSPTTTHATFGPLGTAGQHKLYVEARDEYGLTSIATVQMTPVSVSLNRDLLIVDDTRLEVDYLSSNGTRRNYTTVWPAAAELDTFLYAAGGYPWRMPAAGRAGVSPPGLFAGYSFDTLGTRQGYEIASAGVPLSLLGRYRHVLWLVDVSAATRLGSPMDVINGVSLMRWMNTPGRSSTLSAYLSAGGQVWLAGGAAAYASLIEYNATGTRGNDNVYGLGNSVFANGAGELVPGRLMYDFAHWRSELVSSVIVTHVNRSTRAIGGWSHPGPGYVGTVTAPDYSALPATLRRRALALGDTLPPTRTTGQGATYWTTGTFAAEYLTQPNEILEDADPDPLVTNTISTLDTLYEFQGGPLATLVTGNRPASMTWYHGMESPSFVFTGFSLWDWTRADCAGLVDFVLQRIWGMQRMDGTANRPAPDARRPEPADAAASRLQVGRTR